MNKCLGNKTKIATIGHPGHQEFQMIDFKFQFKLADRVLVLEISETVYDFVEKYQDIQQEKKIIFDNLDKEGKGLLDR